MKSSKTTLFLFILLLASTGVWAQGIGINITGANPDPSAGLDVDFNDRGFLQPRLTTAERDAISNPAGGLTIYNTDTDCMNMWNGNTWRQSCFECDFNAPTVGNNGPICEGGTLSLTATAVSGGNYSWSGPNGFSSSQQNPSIPNATAAAGGVYTLVVSVGGCSANPVTTVATVNATPQTPTAGNNGPACTGNTVSLTASNIIGASYSWSGPNGFSSADQNPNISNVALTNAGVYNVIATLNGCSSAAGSTTLVVNATPSAPTAGSNSPLCSGNTLNLTSSVISGATYAWSGPNAFSSSDQNPSVSNISVSDAGVYSVIATVNGCPSPAATTLVNVNPIPATPVAGSNSPLCFGNTLNLTASTVSGATYTWSGPNAFSSTLQNPSISNAQASDSGVYSVVATANGCTSPEDTVVVSVQGGSGSQVFTYTGSVQSFTVPACISYVTVEALGAQGGITSTNGGLGGRGTADVPVTAGEVLYVYVGGQGGVPAGGWNGGGNGYYYDPTIIGGGGGGASDVRRSGQTLNDRIVVGGGGGGPANAGGGVDGGHGGGTNGDAGGVWSSSTPGGGGTQSSGGSAGSYSCGIPIAATSGSLGQGGNGGRCETSRVGGGGGGGWYGGGGSQRGSGAGGGSGYVDASGNINKSMANGVQSGNGQVTITW